MKANLYITYNPANPGRPHPGWYCVTIETPGFGDNDQLHRTFCHGDDEVYRTAQDALEAALTYFDGAADMFRELFKGRLDNTVSRHHLRLKAKQIDEGVAA